MSGVASPAYAASVSDTDKLFEPAPLEIDPATGRSKITELPGGGGVIVKTPQSIARDLARTEQLTPCGMPYTVVWNGGPARGLPVTAYCAEPLCLDTGSCTGPRFVPHLDQFDRTDPQDPQRRRRRVIPGELVAAARECAKKSAKLTGVDDTRSDKEIARHIGMVWQRMIASIKGDGKWTQSG